MRMFFSRVFLLFIFMLASSLLAIAQMPLIEPVQVQCLGPSSDKKATLNLVYLHGIRYSYETKLQQMQLDHLKKVAKDFSIRIALPVSPYACKTRPSKLCWPHESKDERAQVISLIQAAAKECFPQDAPFSLIGFSNGGYLAAKLVQYCQKTPADWVLAIGAAPDIDPKNRVLHAGCGGLYVAAGELDKVHGKAKEYARSIKKLGANAKFLSYSAGHSLKAKDLSFLIQNILKDQSALKP